MKYLSGLLLVFCLAFSVSANAEEKGYFRLLNNYLALKLHFADRPESGKLVGAAWIRFENRTGEDISSIPLLLNPGLKITSISAEKNKKLRFQQAQTKVEDWPELELNAVQAQLPQKLANKAVYEITINFEGWLKPLTASGMGYVKESLSPDFTVFRFENFGYPIMAPATEAGINAAGRLQNYYQTVSLDVPSGYVPAGNLSIDKTTLLDDRVEYDLKSDTPVPFLVLPIARYNQLNRDSIKVNFLNDGKENAARFADEAERALGLFSKWFGPNPDTKKLSITAIPEGYGSQRMPGLIIQDEAAFNNAENFDELYHEVAHLWHPKETALHPSRWNEGLAMLMQALAEDELKGKTDLRAFKAARFERTKQQFSDQPDYGAIALSEYGDHGMTDMSYSAGAVFFSVLHDLLGHENFLTLIRDMQQEFALTGASTGTFGIYLLENMPNRKAEDFVEGWFLQGTAGQDIKKADSFEELVALYR